jgi:FtsP/CotA-like multicopper oxidase with cupredoxin domain
MGGLAGVTACLVDSSRLSAASAPLLTASTRILEVNGKAAKVFGLTGADGRPGMQLQLGQRFRAELLNDTGEDTLIHWHGLTPPIAQDGVPMLSQAPLRPGERQVYDFENLRSGTHWMHSHVGLQEQKLLAAPLIVRETAEPVFDEQEHVILLHDFTFRDPAEILAELKGGGGGHAAHAGMDHSTMDHSAIGSSAATQPAMLSDIAFDALLANDRTSDDPEVVQAERGGAFRLRIINGAAATNMWIDLGGLEGDLIAVDGHAVHPSRGSVFPLAIAQRADIRLTLPKGAGAWPIRFQGEGTVQAAAVILRSGDGAVARLAPPETAAAALDLALESKLKAVAHLPEEPVSRTEMVMLTGGGSDYSWGLNGKSSMHDVIFTVSEGERIEVMFHNMTGMAHPMHLHGHYFQVVAIGNRRFSGALRDTVLVPAGETVSIRFDANNPGTWAFHCHHLYHMNAGMMGAIAYSSAA